MSSPASSFTRTLALCALSMTVAQGAAAQHLPDTVTTDVLRVCGDPGNMPFSERKEDGFENKIAAIIADELKVKLRYYWLTQGPGFVRNTLGTGLCDLIIGQAFGSDLVQTTNPYYRSSYTLVTRTGELDGITALDDPRLKGKAIGVIAGTPPVNRMGDLGLVSTMKAYAPYQLDPSRKFQTVGADFDGYQSYDKALDVHYLAIAYASTLRNWTGGLAFTGRYTPVGNPSCIVFLDLGRAVFLPRLPRDAVAHQLLGHLIQPLDRDVAVPGQRTRIDDIGDVHGPGLVIDHGLAFRNAGEGEA